MLKTLWAKWMTLPMVAISVAASASDLPKSDPVPGGIIVVDVGPIVPNAPKPEICYEDKPVFLWQNHGRWAAVVGLGLAQNIGLAYVKTCDGKMQYAFQVRNKKYPEQRLTVPNQRHVDPDPEDLRRIEQDTIQIKEALHRFTPTMPTTWQFLLPIQGPRGSAFGLRRFFNGQPRKPHSGIDITASAGVPIRAPLAGTVVNPGDYFFNGNTVFIDHGQGLVSMYCHLDRIDVTQGQVVGLGEPIGTVGATGRVTGPHLHWSVGLNGNLIDPERLLAPNQYLPREKK